MNNAKASKKANIRSLIKTYEVQQKRLLSKIAANKANEAKSVKESKKETKAEINTLSPKRNNNKEDYGKVVYVVDKNDNLVVEKKKKTAVNSTLNIPSMRTPSCKKSKPSNVAKTQVSTGGTANNTNSIANPYSSKKKRELENIKSPGERKNSDVESDQQTTGSKKSAWNGLSLSERLRLNRIKGSTDKNKGGEKKEGNEQNDILNKICVRFQFKAQTYSPKGAKTHGAVLKELLYQMMQGAKTIDKSVAILPWKLASTHIEH